MLVTQHAVIEVAPVAGLVKWETQHVKLVHAMLRLRTR